MIQFPTIPMNTLLDGILISYIHLYLKFRLKKKVRLCHQDVGVLKRLSETLFDITRTEGKLRVNVK